jgi:hypothetical protein
LGGLLGIFPGKPKTFPGPVGRPGLGRVIPIHPLETFFLDYPLKTCWVERDTILPLCSLPCHRVAILAAVPYWLAPPSPSAARAVATAQAAAFCCYQQASFLADMVFP